MQTPAAKRAMMSHFHRSLWTPDYSLKVHIETLPWCGSMKLSSLGLEVTVGRRAASSTYQEGLWSWAQEWEWDNRDMSTAGWKDRQVSPGLWAMTIQLAWDGHHQAKISPPKTGDVESIIEGLAPSAGFSPLPWPLWWPVTHMCQSSSLTAKKEFLAT